MEGPSASHPPASEALPLAVGETAVTSQEIKDLLEAAKQTLPVPFREDGPPLGFEFDPVPFGRKFMAEGHGKSKMMVIGEYNAEAAEDGSIQVRTDLRTFSTKEAMDNRRFARDSSGHRDRNAKPLS